MTDALVIMGPIGVGKTTLCEAIADTFGLSYTNYEHRALQLTGSREGFIANKSALLTVIEKDLRARCTASDAPIVMEASGLSDGPMLRRLAADYRVICIRLMAPASVCVARAQARQPGKNLTNSPEEVATFHAFWSREVSPQHVFALEIDNTVGPIAAHLEAIGRLLGVARTA